MSWDTALFQGHSYLLQGTELATLGHNQLLQERNYQVNRTQSSASWDTDTIEKVVNKPELKYQS